MSSKYLDRVGMCVCVSHCRVRVRVMGLRSES